MLLKQSTAATLTIGPCLDVAGAEYDGLVIGDISLSKNGTVAALAAAATLTYIANGMYTLVLTTANTNTLGRWRIHCNKAGYQIPPEAGTVLTAETFDAVVTNAAGQAGGLSLHGGEMAVASTSVTAIQTGLATSANQSTIISAIAAIPAAVWNVATSSLSGAGSIGKRLVDVFAGMTSLVQILGLIAGKQTPNNTALTEIRATGAGSGTYTPSDDSLEAQADAAAAGGNATVEAFTAEAMAQLAAQGITVSGTTPTASKIDVHLGADHNAEGGSAWGFTNQTGVEWLEMDESTWSIEIRDGQDGNGDDVVATGTVTVVESDFETGQEIQGEMTAAETALLRSSTKAASFFVYQDGPTIGKQLRAWGTARKIG